MQRLASLEVEKVEIKMMVENHQRDMRIAIGVVVDFREQVVDITTVEVLKEKLSAALLEMQNSVCTQVEDHFMVHQTLAKITTEEAAEEIVVPAFMDVLSLCTVEVHAR